MKATTRKLIKFARQRRDFTDRTEKSNRRDAAADLRSAYREYGLDKMLAFYGIGR